MSLGFTKTFVVYDIGLFSNAQFAYSMAGEFVKEFVWHPNETKWSVLDLAADRSAAVHRRISGDL